MGVEHTAWSALLKQNVLSKKQSKNDMATAFPYYTDLFHG
jgi:hypothetical protein